MGCHRQQPPDRTPPRWESVCALKFYGAFFWHHGIRDPKPGKRRVVLKMGRRGPAPAPAQLKLLGGRSPGRDSGGRRVTPPAAFERVAPECPDWLPPGAKDMWGRVVPELAALNLLKESDLGVLTSFCVAWDQLMQAVTAYREQGFIATNARSRRVTVHPAVAAAGPRRGTFWCSRANWGARQALRRIWLLCWRRRGTPTTTSSTRSPQTGDDLLCVIQSSLASRHPPTPGSRRGAAGTRIAAAMRHKRFRAFLASARRWPNFE